MKTQLRKIFWFVLNFFEQGDEPYNYKPLHRTILIVVGVLFNLLCLVSLYLSGDTEGYGFLLPVIVFFTVSFVCLVVGILGNERAVAKMWGQNKTPNA